MAVPYSSDLRRGLGAEEELTVYRIVPTDDSLSASFVDAFRSREELGLPPRTWTPEGEYPELNQGLSAYETAARAHETIRSAARRGRRLGDFVAELRLTTEIEPEIAFWGSRGHLTMWGDAVKLSEAVVAIVAVDEG